MRLKKIHGFILVILASVLATGCSWDRFKSAKTPPPLPPAPTEKLIVHNLTTDIGGKRNHVAAHVDFSNQTGRALDYVMFKTRAFDQKGVEIPALKSGKPNAWLRIAGPFTSGHRTGNQRWEKVWASAELTCFRIEGAELIFDDSSVEFYEMDKIELDLAVMQPSICQPVAESVATTR